MVVEKNAVDLGDALSTAFGKVVPSARKLTSRDIAALVFVSTRQGRIGGSRDLKRRRDDLGADAFTRKNENSHRNPGLAARSNQESRLKKA
jgi:hypothetical protein